MPPRIFPYFTFACPDPEDITARNQRDGTQECITSSEINLAHFISSYYYNITLLFLFGL